MEHDTLRLFNTTLVKQIVSLNDDELWDFLLANQDLIKEYDFKDNYPKTGVLYAFPHGLEHFRKHFLSEIEEYREGVIFTLVVDFCFKGKEVRLGYWARCGYLDNEDSCAVKTSDEIMPPVEEDSEQAHWAKEFFHLLEPSHVENIVAAMEKNFDKISEENTLEDIAEIKAMKEFCLNNDGYKVAYIYDI